MALRLGTQGDGEPIELPAEVLLRHVMALGSSGSGKTVFCKVVVEEAVCAGLPAICVDPQGDLCSLAAGTLDDDELRAQGVDPAWARALRERLEVVVFTPGSERGVPLCADPVDPGLADREGRERVQAITQTAGVVVGLLGFDLDSDDGAGLAAVVDRALSAMIERGERPSLAALSAHLDASGESGHEAYARLLDPKKLRLAQQRLARLDIGARRLLFHGGVPLDVDVLLGRDPRAPVADGKVRVAVIYVNTLHQQDDKDFFVAAIADRLYGWMLANPSPAPQLLFYIDEVAPFIPPVRKPACKEGLSLLFKQARKYGVCCVMATQNPGDVDYRAMAQFGTWALGRLTTRQDLKKVEPTLKSLAPDEADAIAGRLPALRPGELVLLSPDQLEAPVELKSRWLMTRHETWSEERIEAYADALRARFEGFTEAGDPAPDARGEPAEEPAPASGADAAHLAHGGGSEDAAEDAVETAREDAPRPAPSRAADTVPDLEPPLHAEEASEPAEDPADERPEEAPEVAPVVEAPAVEAARDPREQGLLDALADGGAASAQELADRLRISPAAARRALKRLLDGGEVRAFKQGRAQAYWAPGAGGRPDLGLPDPTLAFARHIDLAAARGLADREARTKVLGLIGEAESLAEVRPLHRLVYRLEFEEEVPRGLLAKVFGGGPDERVGHVYLHPHDLSLVTYSHERGVRFGDPGERASDVRDFDGVTELEPARPGSLDLEDADWLRRKSEDEARAAFRARFAATCTGLSHAFVPLWVLLLEGDKGTRRRVTLDGLIGRPVRWPLPVTPA